MAIEFIKDLPDLQHIRRCADKGGGDEIKAVLNAENNILPVALTDKGHGEMDVRHIDALVVGDKAIVLNAADNIAATDAAHGELNEPIVEQDGGALLHIAYQFRKADGGLRFIPFHGRGAQGEGRPFFEQDPPIFEGAEADFRPFCIEHGSNGEIQLLPQAHNALQRFFMHFMVPV